jgi:hypothetical protein
MTGICRSSASSSNSGEASAYITPWPAWITGLWASTSTRVAAAMSRGSPDGLVAFTTLYWSTTWSPTSATATSAGISTMTGPGRPIFNRLNARRMTSDTCSGWFSVSTHLVTEAYVRAELNRGNTCARSRWCPRGSTRIGTESEYAVATPAKAFSAPGPYCMANAPRRRPFVVRLKPSAMPTPTRSWRQSTGRIPIAATASIRGVVGYVLRNSTPSRFMISAIASTTFIGSPFGRGGLRPPLDSPAYTRGVHSRPRLDALARGEHVRHRLDSPANVRGRACPPRSRFPAQPRGVCLRPLLGSSPGSLR